MTTDLFIRTYYQDYQWLSHCLRSIQKFANGFRKVVVVAPNENPDRGIPIGTNEVLFRVHEAGEGYMEQQNTKLHADTFSDAEFFCFMDSDTIFTRLVCPDDLIVDNRRPRWLYTPYASIASGDGQTWKEPTAKIMKRPVEFEFMRRHPLVAPRWALQAFRDWMWRAHGMSLERYIMSQPYREFSEWNALGAYLWFFHHDRIEWQNTDVEVGHPFVWQGFSWGGLNEHIRADLERALA